MIDINSLNEDFIGKSVKFKSSVVKEGVYGKIVFWQNGLVFVDYGGLKPIATRPENLNIEEVELKLDKNKNQWKIME